MTDIPAFNTYTVADPKAGDVWRVTKPTEANPSHVTALNEDGEQIEVGNQVHISQEAFDKYRDYTESLQVAGANSRTLAISAGVRIHDPNALSEEESKALVDRLNETPRARMQREMDERFQAIDNETIRLHTSTEALEQTYNSVMARIGQQRPDLANKPFGFSVNVQGEIVLQNTQGLNAEQVDYLGQALNGEKALVKQAVDVANAHISLTEAESWNKGITLNRENYAKTIDLGADLSYRREAKALPRGTDYIPSAPVRVENYWRQQLADKGERASAR